MDLIEISEEQTMSREDAARLLRQLADSLARHNEVEFNREGKTIRVKVADQVVVDVELEVESDESSLEIEITW